MKHQVSVVLEAYVALHVVHFGKQIEHIRPRLASNEPHDRTHQLFRRAEPNRADSDRGLLADLHHVLPADNRWEHRHGSEITGSRTGIAPPAPRLLVAWTPSRRPTDADNRPLDAPAFVWPGGSDCQAVRTSVM
ncbi:hypothetical protein C3492_31240 [Streptomyces sp. Ru62]|nr:hypothetical protein C3492_31240 [Streptomyces sp. Ru62]